MRNTKIFRLMGIAVVLSAVAGITPATAQRVFIVAGKVVNPDDLTQNDEPRIGTDIVVGTDGLVVITQDWNDPANRRCVNWMVISNATYRVRSERRSGPCRPTPPDDAIDRAGTGQPMVTRMVFFGEGKFDRDSIPDEVRQSIARQSQLERMLLATKRRLDREAQADPGARGVIQARLWREVQIGRQARQRAIEEAVGAPTIADMTGVWRDTVLGGTYYIRQVGNQIWWYGMSNDDGAAWSNVFSGQRDRNVIKGTWADVPHGRTRNQGQLALEITSARALRIVRQTGGFGTRALVR